MIFYIILTTIYTQSIGFAATLNAPSEDTTPGFMPFFTSNRRVSPNLFELVEPAGNMTFIYSINQRSFAVFFRRFDTIRVCHHSFHS